MVIKRLFGFLFRFWVLFHFHVALALTAFYVFVAWSAAEKISIRYAVFLFLSGILGYNLIRLMNFEYNRQFIREFYQNNARFLFLLFMAVLAGWFYEGWILPSPLRYRLILPVLIALLYSPRVLISWLRLREIGFLKILLVALVWALLIVWVPYGWNSITGVWFWPVFLTVVLLIIPFDIRDLSMDPGVLRTLPQVFRDKTFWVAVLIWLVLFLYLFIMYSCGWTDGLGFSIWMGGISLTLWLIKQAPKRQGNYYFSAFWVESVPIWMLMIYVGLNYFFKIFF